MGCLPRRAAVAFVAAGIHVAVGHGVFHGAFGFVGVGAVGIAAPADERAQIAKISGHFRRHDIPQLKLSHAGRVDHIAAATPAG